MVKKSVIFTLALLSAASSFACPVIPAGESPTVAHARKDFIGKTPTVAPKAWRQPKSAQLTADDYAPAARSVYFGH